MEAKKSKIERKRYDQERGLRHWNVRLTYEEAERLQKLAQMRRARITELVYPLILKYLCDCATPKDARVLINPAATLEDEHWGTTKEITNPRKLPERFTPKDVERPKGTQQWIKDEALNHLRAIQRYYRISLDDLAGAAIDHAALQSSAEFGR